MLTPHAIPALGDLAEAVLTLPERYSYPARVCMWMGFLFASALFLRTQHHRWGPCAQPHTQARKVATNWRRQTKLLAPHMTEWSASAPWHSHLA